MNNNFIHFIILIKFYKLGNMLLQILHERYLIHFTCSHRFFSHGETENISTDRAGVILSSMKCIFRCSQRSQDGTTNN